MYFYSVLEVSFIYLFLLAHRKLGQGEYFLPMSFFEGTSLSMSMRFLRKQKLGPCETPIHTAAAGTLGTTTAASASPAVPRAKGFFGVLFSNKRPFLIYIRIYIPLRFAHGPCQARFYCAHIENHSVFKELPLTQDVAFKRFSAATTANEAIHTDST